MQALLVLMPEANARSLSFPSVSVVAEPLHHSDALVLSLDVFLALGKVLVRGRDRALNQSRRPG
jgi:hypothetical protein